MQAQGGTRGIQWRDTPQRYGAVSRWLHWVMAGLLIWQFSIMLLFDILGPSDTLRTISSFGRHSVVGSLVLLLVLVRGAWAWSNRRNRPARTPGLVGRLARAGHLTFYAMMLVIPAIALLRTYGTGKGFSPYGLQLIPATGQEVAWMVAPADALHGLVAWVMLGLIVGHIAMAVAHRVFWNDGVMQRMAGNPR